MTTISWKMQGGFTESDFRNLGSGVKSPEMVWKELEKAYNKDGLDISDPVAVRKIMNGIVDSYADVFKRVYDNSAEDYAAYAVHRIFQNLEAVESSGGGDIDIRSILTSNDKFFEIDKDKKWSANPRSYTLAGNKGKLNSGLYGSFLEPEVFGINSGTGRTARFGDLAEAMHGSISHGDIKSKSGSKNRDVDVGGVKFNIDMVKDKDSYANPDNYSMSREQEDALFNSAVELDNELQIKFADAFDNKNISEYIVGRTLGIFKLFEKVASVILFGVEVQSHDEDRAIFRYTSATTYARLRYDEILEEIKKNPQTSQILGAVNVTVKYNHRPDKKKGEVVSLATPLSIFGQLEIDVKFKETALTPKSVDDFKLGTQLYKDVYNIFSNVQEKTNFFKNMYSEFQQNRDIATNIEIDALKKQMHRFKGQSV